MASSSIFGSTALSTVNLTSNFASSAAARPAGVRIIPDIVFPGPVFQPTIPTPQTADIAVPASGRMTPANDRKWMNSSSVMITSVTPKIVHS